MSCAVLLLGVALLLGQSVNSSSPPAGDSSPPDSGTPPPDPDSSTPPPQAVADPNATDIPPPPTPMPSVAPTYSQPQTSSITLYRKVSQVGILQADGAEIILPGVVTPLVRFVSWQNGHLDVMDTSQDGTSSTTTSWDISSLTSPYQPGNPLKKGYTNNQLQPDDDGSDWVAPDLLPQERPLTVTD